VKKNVNEVKRDPGHSSGDRTPFMSSRTRGEDPPDDDPAIGLVGEPARGSAPGSRRAPVFASSERSLRGAIDVRAWTWIGVASLDVARAVYVHADGTETKAHLIDVPEDIAGPVRLVLLFVPETPVPDGVVVAYDCAGEELGRTRWRDEVEDYEPSAVTPKSRLTRSRKPSRNC
jgi:hypothetical protein